MSNKIPGANHPGFYLTEHLKIKGVTTEWVVFLVRKQSQKRKVGVFCGEAHRSLFVYAAS